MSQKMIAVLRNVECVSNTMIRREVKKGYRTSSD